MYLHPYMEVVRQTLLADILGNPGATEWGAGYWGRDKNVFHPLLISLVPNPPQPHSVTPRGCSPDSQEQELYVVIMLCPIMPT